jgi:hypothetical protein
MLVLDTDQARRYRLRRLSAAIREAERCADEARAVVAPGPDLLTVDGARINLSGALFGIDQLASELERRGARPGAKPAAAEVM